MNCDTIKAKVIAKEYKLVHNPKKGLTSVVWETLNCIYDQDDEKIDDFVACTLCNAVLNHRKNGSTKNLLAHVEKCSGKILSTKQTTISNIIFN